MTVASAVHPTAIVDPKAEIGEGVTIGPYSLVQDNVHIADDCHIGSHVVLLSGTRLARGVKVMHHAVIGEVPQDLKFGNEETTAEIGENTVIREFATVNRGTSSHWRTVVGSSCLIMAYVHIAHDCLVGDNVVIANASNIAGHVEIQDWVIIGGMVGIHQFVKIGQHSLIGGHYRVTKDVPPYILSAGEPLRYEGINSIGLRRRGFNRESITAIKQAYQLIYRSECNVSDALEKIQEKNPLPLEVDNIIHFIQNSERGIIR